MTNFIIKRFSIETEKPEEFIEELDKLCKKYGEYFFAWKEEKAKIAEGRRYLNTVSE